MTYFFSAEEEWREEDSARGDALVIHEPERACTTLSSPGSVPVLRTAARTARNGASRGSENRLSLRASSLLRFFPHVQIGMGGSEGNWFK